MSVWTRISKVAAAGAVAGVVVAGPAWAQGDAAAALEPEQPASAADVQVQRGAQGGEPVTAEGFGSFDEQASYALGLMFGNLIGQQMAAAGVGDQLQPQAVAQGLTAALSGEQPRLTEQEIQETLTRFQMQAEANAQARAQEQGGANAAAGEAFLAENKDQEGVQTLPSGLQYKITEEGDGEKPQPGDTVTLHYKGTLLDGTVFDSSYDRGQPATFALDQVIAGFSEGLQQLPVGSKATLYIPSDLAYGANPRPGGPIGPNATLIFEVELLEKSAE